MKDNTDKIRRLPIVLEARRIGLKELPETLSERLIEIAKKRDKKIFAYRIVYKSQGHRVIGFIIEPRVGKKLPSIIWNRGGSGDFGKIEIINLFTRFAWLAKEGYIVITTQYSGNDGSEGRDEMGGGDIEDVLNLYKILKGYSRSDISKVGMYGASRGGMMTYLALARVKWLKAAVTVSAPANEVSASKFRKDWQAHQIKMYGGSLAERKKRSAIYWANKLYKKTPLLIMHGTADWRVNPLDSIHLAEKLYENQVPYRLVVFEGTDHALNENAKTAEMLTFEWFERFLKKDEKLPVLKPHGK
ncbi:MAG: prolyl oligopeptidase family serine peptidase [bacterium]